MRHVIGVSLILLGLVPALSTTPAPSPDDKKPDEILPLKSSAVDETAKLKTALEASQKEVEQLKASLQEAAQPTRESASPVEPSADDTAVPQATKAIFERPARAEECRCLGTGCDACGKDCKCLPLKAQRLTYAEALQACRRGNPATVVVTAPGDKAAADFLRSVSGPVTVIDTTKVSQDFIDALRVNSQAQPPFATTLNYAARKVRLGDIIQLPAREAVPREKGGGRETGNPFFFVTVALLDDAAGDEFAASLAAESGEAGVSGHRGLRGQPVRRATRLGRASLRLGSRTARFGLRAARMPIRVVGWLFHRRR